MEIYGLESGKIKTAKFIAFIEGPSGKIKLIEFIYHQMNTREILSSQLHLIL